MISMAGKYAILLALLAVTHSWELPNLPSGKRSQYFVLHDDGGYKYGYDTGIDHFGKQGGDANNEVSGHYAYRAADGQNVDIKYTAGVNGFIPEGLEKLHQAAGPYAAAHAYSYSAPKSSYENSRDDQSTSGDASYSFNIDTDSYKRQESSDPSGNIQGRYSYTNEAGQHDLTYIAGENTGFVATSGSLSQPNGLIGKNLPAHPTTYSTGYDYTPPSAVPSATLFNDGSYNFEYSTGDQSRKESSDAAGNVQGSYSFTNEAGTHDLSYVAGSKTGFQPTGGSLAKNSGAETSQSEYSGVHHVPVAYSGFTPVVNVHSNVPNPDGSYSFQYSTGDQSRQESSDSVGNVQGKYSFTNEAGTHDLSYVAGSQTGFQPTGGSLSAPNGLAGKPQPSVYSSGSSGSSSSSEGYSYNPPPTAYSSTNDEDDQSNTGDASYSFTIDTDEYKRQESSDAQGNVKGSYSYKNNAGVHDLQFVAGSETGFLPTGGSLSVPNGANDKAAPRTYSYHGSSDSSGYQYNPPATSYSNKDDDESNTGDASYSFTIDTDDYKRQESSDAQGNVKGTYSYKNVAGSHDLSFVAGSETGFQPTGGSLSAPNGLEGKNIPSSGNVLSRSNYPSGSDEQSSGDASYSFLIDTDEYTRKESADSVGNVKGIYSYKNSAGTHDLSYNAGADIGFVPVSGSLSAPNGLSGPYAAPDYVPPQIKMSDFAQAKAEFSHGKVGNVFLKHYYPSKSQSKYGYIFETA